MSKVAPIVTLMKTEMMVELGHLILYFSQDMLKGLVNYKGKKMVIYKITPIPTQIHSSVKPSKRLECQNVACQEIQDKRIE